MGFIIQVKQLSKTFNLHHFGQKIITGCKDINFMADEGQFIGITGKSGSGKSTLLRCLYRTYLSTEGQIQFQSLQMGAIDLVRASEQQILDLRRREIGYVSQFLSVLPRVTALDLVAETLVVQGFTLSEAKREARRILRHFQLDERLWDTYPQMFSGGEKLRLNLARAMVARPRLLLLDEPTASLDHSSKTAVLDIIMELKRSGTTMIGIFHDLEFMDRVVDDKYVMQQGILSREEGCLT